MRKNLLIIFLIVVVATAGWGISYLISSHHYRYLESKEHVMEWLQQEYKLTPSQYAAIQKLQTEFLPVIKPKIKELHQKKDLYQKLKEDNATPEAIEKAKEDVDAARAVVRGLVKVHVNQVAAQMSPDQAPRYLKRMAEHHLH